MLSTNTNRINDDVKDLVKFRKTQNRNHQNPSTNTPSPASHGFFKTRIRPPESIQPSQRTPHPPPHLCGQPPAVSAPMQVFDRTVRPPGSEHRGPRIYLGTIPRHDLSGTAMTDCRETARGGAMTDSVWGGSFFDRHGVIWDLFSIKTIVAGPRANGVESSFRSSPSGRDVPVARGSSYAGVS